MSAIIHSKLVLIAGLLISLAIVQLNATEYPSPPPVPTKFENAKEIQSYLSKLHTYYMIVGRPRYIVLTEILIDLKWINLIKKKFIRFGKRSFQQNIIKSDPTDFTEENLVDEKLLVEALELLTNWSKRKFWKLFTWFLINFYLLN